METSKGRLSTSGALLNWTPKTLWLILICEVEAARQHLRQAVRLDPAYPDAHYNLAFVCEKLDADAEARQHWEAYVRLDPAGPWCNYARQRLASSKTARSAGTT